MSIKNNTELLQQILEQVQNLPDIEDTNKSKTTTLPYEITVNHTGDVPDLSEFDIFYGNGQAIIATGATLGGTYTPAISVTPASVQIKPINYSDANIQIFANKIIYYLNNITSDVEISMQWHSSLGDY